MDVNHVKHLRTFDSRPRRGLAKLDLSAKRFVEQIAIGKNLQTNLLDDRPCDRVIHVIEDIKVGTGAVATAGQIVTVHYTGWTLDGTQFDSSVDRGTPFEFALGAGQVIKGWDQGVEGMKIGGKRKLRIPADLAYGSQGAGSIPPNSVLVFDVELLGVK